MDRRTAVADKGQTDTMVKIVIQMGFNQRMKVGIRLYKTPHFKMSKFFQWEFLKQKLQLHLA